MANDLCMQPYALILYLCCPSRTSSATAPRKAGAATGFLPTQIQRRCNIAKASCKQAMAHQHGAVAFIVTMAHVGSILTMVDSRWLPPPALGRAHATATVAKSDFADDNVVMLTCKQWAKADAGS